MNQFDVEMLKLRLSDVEKAHPMDRIEEALKLLETVGRMVVVDENVPAVWTLLMGGLWMLPMGLALRLISLLFPIEAVDNWCLGIMERTLISLLHRTIAVGKWLE